MFATRMFSHSNIRSMFTWNNHNTGPLSNLMKELNIFSKSSLPVSLNKQVLLMDYKKNSQINNSFVKYNRFSSNLLNTIYSNNKTGRKHTVYGKGNFINIFG